MYRVFATITLLYSQSVCDATMENHSLKIHFPFQKAIIWEQQNRFRNFILRRLIDADYKKIKFKILSIQDYTNDKINTVYQKLVSNYYDLTYRYYTMDENDRYLIDNLMDYIL